MENEQKYFYVFNDKEMANIIKKATGQSYMKFNRDNGIAYSFINTKEVKIAYKAANSARIFMNK